MACACAARTSTSGCPAHGRWPARWWSACAPKSARLWSAERTGLLGPVRGTVAFTEALGRETFVGVDVGGSRIVVYEEGRADLLPGDPIEFGLLPEAVAFFDPDTGVALAAADLAAR